MAFPFNDDRHDAPKPSRGGQARGTCPWAQDSDTNQFARGPPSSRGKRGDGYGGASAVAPTRTSFKPQGSSSAPWAADEAPVWDKPMNAYGAGLNAAPASGYGYGNNQYAEPLPDDDDYGYGAPPPSMPVARSPMQGRGGGGAAPWATDENEPIISASQAAYRGGGSRVNVPPSRQGPTLSAKEMKAKMQGAGNLLSWN